MSEAATEPAPQLAVDAIVPAGILQQLVETYTPISSEGRLNFDEDGVHVKVVGPANVAMALSDLSTDAFESFESVPTLTIGVNFDRLDEALSIAGTDDLVHLTVDMESRKCHLGLGNVDQTIRLIDPEVIRKEPELPDLELPNSITVESGDLDTVRKVADMVSDHLELQGDPGAEEARFVAQGDIEDSTVTFGHDDVLDAKLTEEVSTLVSLDYFHELSKPIPTGTEVEILFGDDFPMLWEWEASDGHQETTQMLAPRIRS